ATRFLLAAFALIGLPSVVPSIAAYVWVFGAYMLAAFVFQWMIWKRVGGVARAIVSGIVDLALITFIVHRLGSGATMMVALYFFAGAMNTVVVGRREGLVLAAAGAVAYDGLLLVEQLGWLPYAPDRPHWIVGTPTPIEAMSSGLM